MKSLEKRQEFIRLRGMGESFEEISVKIGVSKRTLITWGKLYKQEISEAKTKALDNVLEEYDFARSGRLKIIAKDMRRIDGELSKRDLASIPTHKLIQMKFAGLGVAEKILIDHSEQGGSKLDTWKEIIERIIEK